MNGAEIVHAAKRIAEYRALVRYFDSAGLYPMLERAHSTPISVERARELVESYGIECRITTRTKRGRAYRPGDLKTSKRYSITLPVEPGVGFRRLRLGLVLHEIAHVLDHRKRAAVSRFDPKMNHGLGFRKRFSELLIQWGSDGAQCSGEGAGGSREAEGSGEGEEVPRRRVEYLSSSGRA